MTIEISKSAWAKLSVAVLMGASFVFPNIIFGQEEAESFYELSPFTVEDTDSVGYQATSTLAGTRLNTELRDVGAAISVLTAEFFEDTGATDAGSVLSYALNMEVSGVQGNYAGGAPGAQTYDNAAERRSPQSSGQRVRGLARASLTRGYFLTDIPFDGYNTTSITINRGPNSLLFGIGEVGGVIDNGVKRAAYSRNFGEIGIRIGEHGSHRETIDVNKVIIEDRLAIRFSALNENIEYQQRPAYEEDKRIYLALDAVLFQNEGSSLLDRTIIRANFEEGEIQGTPPNIIPPTDGLSPWFSLPRYSASDLAALNDGVLNPRLNFINDGSFVPKATYDTRITGSSQNNIANTGRSPFFFNLPVTYNDVNAQTASVGLPSDPGIQGWVGRIQWNRLNPKFTPYTKQIDVLSLQPIEVDYMPGFVAPVVMNRSVLNNENLLLSGTTSFLNHDFDALNIAVEQGLFEGRAGIELAFDKQNYENDNQLRYDSSRSNFLWIDLNEYLPDLQPNPNVGRAFMVSDGVGDNEALNTVIERESSRGTAFYKLDFAENENWTKWLGNHVFTGVLSRQQFDTLTSSRLANWVDVPGSSTDIAAAQAAKLNESRRGAYMLNYVSGDLRGSGSNSISDVTFTDYIKNPIPKNGDRYTMIYSPNFNAPKVNPATGTAVFRDEFEVYYALSGGDHTEQTIDSEVISWQGNFLDGHVVTLLGFRDDESTTYGRAGSAVLASGEWDSANLLLDRNNPNLDQGSTVTKSVVVHLPEKWTEAMPFDMSLHYNESENFSALPTRNNVQREQLASPTGETKDYGVTFEFLERQLSLRVNWFETKAISITADAVGVDAFAGEHIGAMLNRAFINSEALTIEEYLASPLHKSDATGRFGSWDELYDEIMSLSLASSHGNQYSLDQSQAVSPFGTWLNPVERAAATTSFVTEGMEIELIGNLTQNWRIALNIGKQETVESGTASLMGKVAYQLRDEIAASKLDGLNDYVALNGPDTFGSRLQRIYLNPLAATLAKDGKISQEQRKWRWNLVSSYHFDEGLFKGFTLGGALRWQDKAAVGYESLSVISGAVTPNLDRPFFDSEQFNGDVFASFQKQLTDKISWKIQLNVRNAYGDDDYIPVFINPDGNVAVVRNANPQEVFLTNTFSF
jgi:hypothetical protein